MTQVNELNQLLGFVNNLKKQKINVSPCHTVRRNVFTDSASNLDAITLSEQPVGKCTPSQISTLKCLKDTSLEPAIKCTPVHH